MQALQNIAVRAARAAGDTIMRATANLDLLKKADIKGRNDFVTEVDYKAEQKIIETIRKSYPDHAFLAEESGEQGDSDHVWIIDPLDGTTNFVRGVPHFAVSIACRVKGRIEVGVVYDPIREELFTASRGSGAQLNDKRIRVSQARGLEQSLLATGFPYRDMDKLSDYLSKFEALYKECGDMRRAGCASLDLAYVAAGRHDGFWEFGLKEWDYAAGALLVSEAGGIVGDLAGNPTVKHGESLLAANPKVYKAILKVIK
ncbi:inositol monophosphatase family protein [Pleionea sp. CnH1-48]|uniref:inositol monophosphatase family protein n=1 Tax=Pleionea sp. CnH1-48 TaxID=2954494 RepID=UPI0020977A73|nr:inositol monophosphatase family protein [Pleionea sp. CnH1-48]MCO7226874.1 inositol monophosphatase [Pleionea sp. CnH1-48]